MSIEEAEYILNEVVITQPSINGYTYISAEEINGAINKLLEEKVKDEKRIKELEIKMIEKEMDIEGDKVKRHKGKYMKKLIKYIKKVVKPLFLLEN